MKIDKLGDISPIAGIATGEGLMGKLASAGGLGLLPAGIARNAQDDEEKKKQQAGGAAPTGATMKKGGKVSSASKRADGIATKGKTRGTMITMKGGGYAC
jgi:hypothetical protein